MKKRDFETYHKRFRDFEILTKFSETHVFRGTIHPPNRVFSLLSDNRKTDFLLSMLFRHNVIHYEVCVHITHVSKSETQLDSCRKVCS